MHIHTGSEHLKRSADQDSLQPQGPLKVLALLMYLQLIEVSQGVFAFQEDSKEVTQEEVSPRI
jgi:hypothetical protein